MQQFGQHLSSWSYSTDGGQSFAQPSTDRASPALLPTVFDGTQNTTDDTNDVLAWDNANATLYMASTSYPTRSDINVYASNDGGRTFLSGADATPGAPTAYGLTTATYDKPSLAADNYPGTGDGTGYGALYLAYVQSLDIDGNLENQIVITGLAPGLPGAPLGSWPTPSNQDQPPGFILATGLVQSPEVLVEPDHSVDVVYMTPDGIYLIHSKNPLSQYGWQNPQPKELASYQQIYPGFPSDNIDVYLDDGSGDHPPSLVGIPPFPSVAIGTIPGGDTYLYCAYMDGNLDPDTNQFDGTFGIYTFQYDLNTRTMVGNPSGPFGPIAPDNGVITNEWMPSIAVSPDGRYAFIGFYGGNGSFDLVSSDPLSGYADQQYNMFYVAGPTSASGTNWGNVTQITNVDATGNPTGATFDQPNGPNFDGSGGGGQTWYPDYDSVSADYQNFHYSFMGTSDEQVTGSDGSQVTLQAQTDVYMANIAIPYVGTAPPTPTPVTATKGTDQGGPTLTISWPSGPYSSLDATAYIEYSVAGQGWLSLTTANPANGSVTLSNELGGDPFPLNMNYSPDTTYYFRVRVQYTPDRDNNLADAASGWSAVYVAPGSNTMVFTGTSANDTIVLTKDSSSNSIDFTLNGVAQPSVSIISGGNLLVEGLGGDDTIKFDLSEGNFLAADNTIDNDGGSMKLDIVGTASADTVSMLGGGSLPYIFDGTNVNVLAGLIDSLQYEAGGGNDAISVSGAIPAMVNLSTGDSTLTNSDSARVYVVPGAGTITLSAIAGRTIFPASTTTGIRQINFAALDISSGAYVLLADSSATYDDFSNHANRSVAVIDAGGLSIAAGGTLDIGDNDMILRYASGGQAAADALVLGLLTSGFDGGGFDTPGINSSEASYDAYSGTGTTAVGWADNNDIGYSSFDGVDVSDLNEVMIKFTYYGDSDLDGTVDANDFGLFAAGKSGAGTGWAFGNYDYNATTADANDFGLFAAGDSGYQEIGTL